MSFYQPTQEEIIECRGDWLFCDGGVIQRNPSPIGGTWAWVHVRDGDCIDTESGVVLPLKNGAPAAITNNYAELYALARALRHLSFVRDWAQESQDKELVVASDSQCTLRRATSNRTGMTGIPPAHAVRFRSIVRPFALSPNVRWCLLSGHPTKEQIAAGIGSKWNVMCDRLCNEAGRAFIARGLRIAALEAEVERQKREADKLHEALKRIFDQAQEAKP